MATCALTTSITLTCDDKRQVGGTQEKAWIVSNMTDFSYTTDGNGYITALSFVTYGGLVTLEGLKNSHSGGYTVQVTEGGSKFYQHNVSLKTISTTPTDDTTLEDLLVANSAIILETRNREFLIYGINNGMDQTEGTQSTGSVATSDIADVITLVGEEREKPKRFLATDYATTLALLESYEI
jgi:hypothetical protein